jgi:WD40 repeat protein
MPPEQARGERHLTTAADVYALGAILYEVLTGRPPFRAGTMIDTVLQVLGREPDHPRKVNPAADGDLSVIALKCLEKDPARRYASAAAVADDLDRWLRGEPVSISPATRWERAAKWVRRNPLPTALAASLLIGTAVATGLAVYATREADRANWEAGNARVSATQAQAEATRADGETKKAKVEAARADDESKKAKAAERVARRQAADAVVTEGLRLFDEGRPITGQLWFAEALTRNPDDGEYLSLHRQRIDVHERFTPRYRPIATLFHPGPVSSVSFSSDGRRVVIASWDKTARVWDAETWKPLTPPLDHKDIVSSASFAPDGRRVVTASRDKTARVWDAETGQPLTPPLEHKGWVYSASFAPDGRRVVSGRRGVEARVWDAGTGQQLTPPLEHKRSVVSASFSSDGRRILTLSEDNTARVWDAETGKPITPPLEHKSRYRVKSASFAPNGRLVVTATYGGTIQVWDVDSGQPLTTPLEKVELDKPLTLPLEHIGQIKFASFAADDRQLFIATYDTSARVWDAGTGQPLTPPLVHNGPVRDASLSLDGRQVVTASADKTARVWDAETGKPLSPPLEHKNPVSSASFSPDGRRVVTVGFDNSAHVWDVSARDWPDSDRVKIAQAMSGTRIDNTGSIHPLTADEHQSIWNEMKGKNPAEFAGMSIGHQKLWYADRLDEAEKAKDSFAAAFHLRQLLKLDPANAEWKAKLATTEEELLKRQPREAAPPPRVAK